MDGMINYVIESFLKFSYGNVFWNDMLCCVWVELQGFFSMFGLKLGVMLCVLNVVVILLGKFVYELFEDLGVWLVWVELICCLLCFGGCDFGDFVLFLEEFLGWVCMILLDLVLEELQVLQDEMGDYVIGVKGMLCGWIWVIVGVLCGMVDDYGMLVLILVDGCIIMFSIVLVEYVVSCLFDFVFDYLLGQVV